MVRPILYQSRICTIAADYTNARNPVAEFSIDSDDGVAHQFSLPFDCLWELAELVVQDKRRRGRKTGQRVIHRRDNLRRVGTITWIGSDMGQVMIESKLDDGAYFKGCAGDFIDA